MEGRSGDLFCLAISRLLGIQTMENFHSYNSLVEVTNFLCFAVFVRFDAGVVEFCGVLRENLARGAIAGE